jgi:hypothetical protein
VPRPIQIGFQVSGDAAEEDRTAARIGFLAAYELRQAAAPFASCRVVRVETPGGEHFYRLEVVPEGRSGPSRLKSQLLGILEEISKASEEGLAEREAAARLAGFVGVDLVRETDPRGKHPWGAGTPPRDPDGAPLSGARLYRYERAKSRVTVRTLAIVAVVVALLAGGVFLWSPLNPSNSPTMLSPGRTGGGGGTATIDVQFGTPTKEALTCGNGDTVSAEKILWKGASAPITTADVILVILELADGDVIGTSQGASDVTSSNDCAGAPPAGNHAWYAVLTNPSGTNVAVFDYASSWTAVGGEPPSVSIAAGSTLTVVIVPGVAGQGYGIEAVGSEDGPPVQGGVAL